LNLKPAIPEIINAAPITNIAYKGVSVPAVSVTGNSSPVGTGVTVGSGISVGSGESVGTAVGVTVGVSVGVGETDAVTVTVTVAVGETVGVVVGGIVGETVAVTVTVGETVGVSVGDTVTVGETVGVVVGETVVVSVGDTVAVGETVVVSVGVTVAVGETVGVGAAGIPIVFVSNVTAPFLANNLPSNVALVVAVIDVNASMLPLKTDEVPRVAEDPTCQKTLYGDALLMRLTTLEDAVVNVLPIWNMNTAFGSPCASRTRVPVS
jgi:hypothetical protein